MKWKALFRDGIPDQHKREAILAFFQIRADDAEGKYAIVKEVAGEDFIRMAKESRQAQSKARFTYLTKEGESELEFILLYLIKKLNIKTGYIIAHVGQILFLFLKPAEVYCVIETMIDRS
jgi:hypothetical protein